MTQQEAVRAVRCMSAESCGDVQEAVYVAAQSWPGMTYRNVIAAITVAAEVALIAHGASRILGRQPSAISRQSSE